MCIGIKTRDPLQAYQNGTTKQKDRNNEERKEKAKDAARTRRMLETEYFQELEKLLPITETLSPSQHAGLDKTSIIRLNIAQLRVKDVLKNGIHLSNGKGESVPNVDLFSCLDGFSLVIGCGGEVIYVSENVCRYLGLTQVELLGQQFSEYVHPCDHNQLNLVTPRRIRSTDDHIEIFVRVKCTVTERGRMVNLKQAGHKSLKISGKACHMPDQGFGGVTGTVFIGLARCVMEREVILEDQIGFFTTKHSVDMKFVETNQWVSMIAGFRSTNVLSFYDLVHAQDIENVQITFKHLVDHGQCETPLYRLLCHGGGYVWLQTKAFLTTSRLGQSILCTHRQISEVLNREEILSIVQMKNKPNIDKSHSHGEDHVSLKHAEISNGHAARTGSGYLPESMNIKPQQNPTPPIITSYTEKKIVNTPTSVIVSCVKTPSESTSVPVIQKTAVPEQNKEFLTRRIHSEERCLMATTQSVFNKSETLQRSHNTSELLENLLPIINLNDEQKLKSDENYFLDDILDDMERRSPHSGDQFVAIENKDQEKEKQKIEASFDNIHILNFDDCLKPIENLTFDKTQVLIEPITNALWDTDRKHMDPYDHLNGDKIIMLGKTGKQDTEEQESDHGSSLTKVMEYTTNMDSFYNILNQAEDFRTIGTHSKVYSGGNTKLNMTTQCIFEKMKKNQEPHNSSELLEELFPVTNPNRGHELESGDNDFLEDILKDMDRRSPHSGDQCVSIQNKDHEREKINNIGAKNFDNIQGLNFDDKIDEEAREFMKTIKNMTFNEAQILINPSTNTMWDTGRQSGHLEHNIKEPGHSIWNEGTRKRCQSNSTFCPEHLQSRTTLDQKQRFGRNFSESCLEPPGDKILLWGKTGVQNTDAQESNQGLLNKRFKFSPKSKSSKSSII